MVNKRKSELTINLNEVHEDGESYTFTRKSGELNEALKDIVGKGDYEIELTITPIGDAYELKGRFKADMNLVCSRCAFDFNNEISEEFHELLMVSKELPRTGQMSKTNHSTEGLSEGPFFNEIRSSVFSLSDFAHEVIALAEPLNPTGKENCDENCENLKKAYSEGWLKEEEPAVDRQNPFAVLQNLKH